jgi:hypothetical protein
MPCYDCITSLIEMHGKYTLPEVRERATNELYEKVDKANGREGLND